MKRILLTTILVLGMTAVNAFAITELPITETFQLDSIGGLTDNDNYAWGIDYPSAGIPSGYKIQSATLTIKGLQDPSSPNKFYVYLLDAVKVNSSSASGNVPTGFEKVYSFTTDLQLDDISNVPPSPGENVTINFSSITNALTDLNGYITDDSSHNFGIGLNPDCEITACDVDLSVTYGYVPGTGSGPPAAAPEPSTLILLGAGLGGFALWRRRTTK